MDHVLSNQALGSIMTQARNQGRWLPLSCLRGKSVAEGLETQDNWMAERACLYLTSWFELGDMWDWLSLIHKTVPSCKGCWEDKRLVISAFIMVGGFCLSLGFSLSQQSYEAESFSLGSSFRTKHPLLSHRYFVFMMVFGNALGM